MAEGSGASGRGGVGPASASGRRCCGGGGCGIGLARLVRRLRRQGTRALCASAPRARRRGCQQQYDPLSYARNFDLGGDGDGARLYHSCSFSSRFVLAPAGSSSSSSSSAAVVAAPPGGLGSSRPIATASH
ncbi:hypothetical protein ACP70R_028864 [Stipagrostis hirtigluma subsp. patula]